MTRFEQFLRREGEDVAWHKRQEGSLDPETGDRAVTWTTETIRALVQSVSANEVLVEAGHTSQEYIRVFLTANIQHKDRLTWRDSDYEVQPPESQYFKGALEYRTALCRRLNA